MWARNWNEKWAVSRRSREAQKKNKPWDEWSSMHIIFMAYCNDIRDSINHSTDFSSDIFMFRSYVAVQCSAFVLAFIAIGMAYNFVVFLFLPKIIRPREICRWKILYCFFYICLERSKMKKREREIEILRAKRIKLKITGANVFHSNFAILQWRKYIFRPKSATTPCVWYVCVCVFSWPIPCFFYSLHKIFIHIISWLFRLCHIIQIEMIFSSDHARLFVWLLQFWWVGYIE